MKKFYILGVTMFFCVLTSYSQSGSLDVTFGQGGKVNTNIVDLNKSDDGIYAMAIQPDGKLIVAGVTRCHDYPTSSIPSMVVRYNADGTPDNSFDYDGQFFAYGFKFTALAIQPDGKIVVAGTSFSLIRLNANGTFDNSFGNNGTASVPLGSTVTCMKLQADGKIVLGGYVAGGFALARFNIDGTPDNSFDGDGYVLTDFGPEDDQLKDLAIQGDGKIVVVGHTVNGSSKLVALARYDINGTLDNSFDGDGKLTATFGTTNDLGRSVAIQPDGKIVVSGSANSYQALARFTSAGGVDNTFDGDGQLVTTILGHPSFPPLLALQNDGKILTLLQLSNDYGVCRYNSDGSPDNSFDGDGKVTTDINANGDYPTCMAVQSNGRIFIGGYTLDQSARSFSIACFQTNGSLDNGFNGNGKIFNSWGVSWDFPRVITVQTDGKIITAGSTAPEDISNSHDFAIARYNANGTLDNTFDGDGKLDMTPFGYNTRIYALAIQSDGKIIAAGVTKLPSDIVIARFNSNGTLDNSFDGDGVAVVVPTAGYDAITSVAIQTDGKIVLSGSVLLIRLNSNGTPDNSFDGDGILTTTVGGNLAIQNDGKILVAGVSNSDFAIVRYNSNGTIDNSFDGDGMVTTDFGSTGEWISSIKIQSDGKIVAGGISGNSFALARYNSDGSPDNSFDGDGKQMTDMAGSGGGTKAYTLAIQSNGKIVMSGETRNTTDDFILARYNSDGSLDNSFDGDGKLTLDLAPGSNDHLVDMAIASNRIYMLGYTLTVGGYDFTIAAVVEEPLLGPLPLQLRDFSGRRVNDDALLNWKTENETNMLEYTVERSIDGRNYSAVGTVTAANRAGIHYYNLTDQNITSLNASVIYYRLKQKGIDGKFAHSRIVALPLDKNKNLVLFYPNPVINEANVALTVNRQEKLQVRIVDNTGRIVKQQQWNVSAGSTSLSIDVTNLAKGMYYLEIKGESIDYKKQFIK